MTLSKNICIIFQLLLCFNACKSRQFDSSIELETYIEKESGLRMEKSDGDITFSVIPKSSDLFIAQEWNLASIKSDKELSRLRKKYENYYFVLNISKKGHDPLLYSGKEFATALQKIAFEADRYTYITLENGNSIKPSQFHYPRLYGYSGNVQLLYVFSKSELSDYNGKIKFTIDKLVPNTSKQEFIYNISDLNNLPTLTFAKI